MRKPVMFVNETDRVFTPIYRAEKRRTYTLCSGGTYVLENPDWLSISSSGHYVLDNYGVFHFIPFEAFDVVSWDQADPDSMPLIVR